MSYAESGLTLVSEHARERWRRDLWPVAAAVVLGLFLPCSSYDLWLPDEPRVAHTAYEMGRTSSYLLPEVNETPFLQIPPLHYWLLNGWFAVFGASDRSARYLSAWASLGTVLVLASLAWRYGGARLAAVTAGVLASTVQFWDVAHRVVVETSLTCFLTATFACLGFQWIERRRWWLWSTLAGVSLGAAFLAKGVPGPVYVFFACLASLFLRRSWRSGREWGGLAVLGLTALLVALPWAGVFWYSYPAEFRELTIDHVVRRVVDGGVKNPPVFEFLHRTAGNLLPWAFVLPVVILAHARCAWGRRRGERFLPRSGSSARWSEFLLLWAWVPVVLLTISRSKRQLYLLPVFPPFALLTATWLEDTFHRLSPRASGVLLWGGFVAGVAGTLVAAERTFAWGRRPSLALYLIAALLVYMGLRWLPRRHWPTGTVGTSRLVVLAVLAVATWGTAYHLVKSPQKSVALFGRELERLEESGLRIIGYRLTEREVGAAAWYLKHPFPLYDGAVGDVEATYGPALVIGDSEDLEVWAGRSFGAKEVLVEKKLRRRTLHGVSVGEAGNESDL